MAGLVQACPGHPRLAWLRHCKKDVDARDKRGHDAGRSMDDRWPMNVLGGIETAVPAAKRSIYHGWLVVGTAFLIALFA
jgi:hypothetical protein